MIVTDASVWVSHLIAQEIHHEASRRWLSGLVQNNTVIVAPALLLAEVGGAIARRTGDGDLGRQAVKHILSIPNLCLVYTDSELGMLAADLAADHQIRGADAMYVAVAARLSIPLVSWGREQVERASQAVTAQMPNQI